MNIPRVRWCSNVLCLTFNMLPLKQNAVILRLQPSTKISENRPSLSFSSRINKSKSLRAVYRRADKIVLPGFHGMSLYVAGKFFARQLQDVRLNERSAAVTYSFLLAIPPSLLFFCSLVPYLPLRDVEATILTSLRKITPNDGLATLVSDFLNKEQRGLLSFGVLMTLFFSSNGMMGLMRAFDHDHAAYKFRNGLKRRWMAIKLTMMLLLVVIISIAALVLQSEFINEYLELIFRSLWAVKLFSMLILLGLVFMAISTIYRYGPSLTHKSRFITPGSIAATILCIAMSAGFFFAVNHFLQYNKLYGSIGTLIAFMVWIWLNVLVILICFELNISLLLGKLERQNEDRDEE